MEAGGVGCADNRCQNNKTNEFGLNGKMRQVFCNREQEMGSGLENRERKKTKKMNQSYGGKRLPELNVRSM